MMNNNHNKQEEYEAPLRDNIGALWQKQDKTGRQYFVGNITVNGFTQEIIIFVNTDKRSGRQPDYVVREQVNRDSRAGQRTDGQRASQRNW